MSAAPPRRWRVSRHAIERYRERVAPLGTALVAAILARLPGTVVRVGEESEGRGLYRDPRRPMAAEYVVDERSWTVVTVVDPTAQSITRGRVVEVVR